MESRVTETQAYGPWEYNKERIPQITERADWLYCQRAPGPVTRVAAPGRAQENAVIWYTF